MTVPGEVACDAEDSRITSLLDIGVDQARPVEQVEVIGDEILGMIGEGLRNKAAARAISGLERGEDLAD